MIEVVRGLGLAARFVSGYLYDKALDTSAPPGVRNTGLQQGVSQVESRDEPLVVGAGATHAWLNVYLPGAGWVPYDPTNTLVGGTDLIRVAYSRRPEQAAPVSGSWFGVAGDYAGLEVRVSVRRVEQPDPAVAVS
jgi:transglutaminase-like putative cysteine protease